MIRPILVKKGHHFGANLFNNKKLERRTPFDIFFSVFFWWVRSQSDKNYNWIKGIFGLIVFGLGNGVERIYIVPIDTWIFLSFICNITENVTV